MAGYSGQELVPSHGSTEWMEQCYPASALFPGFSSEAFGPDLHRWELGPIQELGERCTLLQGSPLSPDDLMTLVLTEELKAAKERESVLSNSLNSITRSLHNEMHYRKEREAVLLLLRNEFEVQIVEWARLYSMALASYQESEEELRIKQMDQEEADRAVDAQLEELKNELAYKQTQLHEKNLKIEEKERAILALEEGKQAFMEEMQYVINSSIMTLWGISEQVLDLTVDLQKFQLRNKHGEKATTARPRPYQEMPRPYQEMPTTLVSCAEDVSKKITFARSALHEAFKEWKKAEAGLEIMQSHNRKRLLARILGKEEPDAAGERTSAPDLNGVD